MTDGSCRVVWLAFDVDLALPFVFMGIGIVTKLERDDGLAKAEIAGDATVGYSALELRHAWLCQAQAQLLGRGALAHGWARPRVPPTDHR